MSRAISRRHFCTVVGSAFAAAVVGDSVTQIAFAAELPHLAVEDPKAHALHYAEDASKVDPKRFPTHAARQACVNCNLYSGKPGSFGPCELFPGKAVSSNGWCTGWQKER